MTFWDGVYIDIATGQLLNVPWWNGHQRRCTCECDGENPRCEKTIEAVGSRCLPCGNECPGVKVHGPRPSEVRAHQRRYGPRTKEMTDE